VQVVAKGLGMDRRIGSKFLHAGRATAAAASRRTPMRSRSFARAAGEKVGIVEAAIEANDRQMARMVDKVCDAVGDPKGRKVAVLGLAFKPNTDEHAAAPSLHIIRGLLQRGLEVVAFDPVAMPKAAALPELRDVQDGGRRIRRRARRARACHRHRVERVPDARPARLRRLMKQPVLCDLRNIYSPDEIEEAGWRHTGVGKGRPGVAPRRSRSRVPAKKATRQRA